MTRSRPTLIYDGDCHFCRKWIERWRVATGEKVDYRTADEAAADFPDIPRSDFEKSVQWIGGDGERAAGARAVFLALATGSTFGRMLLAAYRGAPPFAALAEGLYRLVARQRGTFSFLTRVLWGGNVLPPTYATSTGLFLRALGFIYLIAFVSYWAQFEGLIGAQGILPAAEFFSQLRAHPEAGGFWQWPSLGWWDASSTMFHVSCAVGVVAALLLTFGLFPAPSLVVLWFNYLSLVVAGQIFYSYQWDTLLIETGFLAIFLAPWRCRLGSATNPPRVARFLLVWLLFRLMFESGVVKLTSGDPMWSSGRALEFHYFTQPLPTPLAWYAHQLPEGIQWLSVKLMFFVELVLPFVLFGPRRVRLLAVAGIVGLQVMIALTGNYGFFNWLGVALCLLAVDDATWRRVPAAAPSGYLPRPVLWPVAVVIVVLSTAPLAWTLGKPTPAWLTAVYRDQVRPWRTINGYGLFAIMTTERREIIVQGSEDGLEWKTIGFRYKPGNPLRHPPWVAPYMPRLDWQMWFAALRRIDGSPWVVRFAQRLLEGSPPVRDLLGANPFPDAPPRYIRMVLDDYTFTTSTERRESGRWWNVEPAALYGGPFAIP